MKRIFIIIVILYFTTIKCSAAELDFSPPALPESAKEFLTEEPENFHSGLSIILKNALPYIYPAFAEAAAICTRVTAIVVLLGMMDQFTGISKDTIRLTGTLALSVTFLSATKSLIPLGENTIHDITEYGKLLLPVMTGALAAQGYGATSGALYIGTAFFDAVLSTVIDRVLLPALYGFLALSIAVHALGETSIGKMKDSVKSTTILMLKIILYTFTGYMTITGAVSGSADALAIKAAKITISGMVPMVGGVLSDASEAVLVSSAIMKNAAGVYGILAMLSIVIGPFIRIGMQYLLLKLTAIISSTFGQKNLCSLIQDYSAAMGLILSMTAAVSFMLLISTVCFMKVVI